MGFNDRYPDDYIEHIVNCEYCGKKFRFNTQEQMKGFRSMGYLYCPYCKTEVARSMSVEFSHVEGLEEEDEQ